MVTASLESVSHEKGWGTFFDVRAGDNLYRFSIALGTLNTAGLRHRTKKTFPEVFESNTECMLLVAKALIESSRLNPEMDIGGTEILPEHLLEVINA